MEPQTEPRKLTLMNLYTLPPVEIQPMPGNEYEIAPDSFAKLRIPTVALCKKFDTANKPLDDLGAKTQAYLIWYNLTEAEQADTTEPPQPMPIEFQETMSRVAVHQSELVLDFGSAGSGKLTEEDLFIEPMAKVVRNHFLFLRSPTRQKPGVSSGEGAEPESGQDD